MFEKEPTSEDIKSARISAMRGLYDFIDEDGIEFDLDGSTWNVKSGKFRAKLGDPYNLRAVWIYREDFDGRAEEFGIGIDPMDNGEFESYVIARPNDLDEEEALNWKVAQIDLEMDKLNNDDWERVDEVVNYLSKRKKFNDTSKKFLDHIPPGDIA